MKPESTLSEIYESLGQVEQQLTSSAFCESVEVNSTFLETIQRQINPKLRRHKVSVDDVELPVIRAIPGVGEGVKLVDRKLLLAGVEEIKKLIVDRKLQRIYQGLWERIFPDGVKPVRTIELVELRPSTEDVRDGYRHELQTIRIVADEQEIEEIVRADEENLDELFRGSLFPKWIGRLLHEMSHEYEWKVVQGTPTQRGHEVRVECQMQYPEGDPEHGENFFTGIVAVANALNVDPVQLVVKHGL